MQSALRGVSVLALAGHACGSDTRNSANPIRRVVGMLQKMQQNVAAEGEKEKELFDKFMCYCQNGAQDLQAAIDASATKGPQVAANVKSAEAKKAQLESEVEHHQNDKAESKKAIAAAIALREKQNVEYLKDKDEYESDIKQMDDALKVLGTIAMGGSMGGFLQTQTNMRVKQLALNMELSPADRDQVVGFLSEGGRDPGPAIGILTKMKETEEKELAELTATEEQAVVDSEALVAAKKKQIQSNTDAVEEKLERIGNLGVEIAEMKGDLGDSEESLAADKEFLADLDKTCATKEKEWDARQKLRSEEMLALADTIKILNDDDALELFKKTLPAGASLLQTQVAAADMRKEALQLLRGHHNTGLDLIALSLRGKKANFDKILKMVDEMVKLLGEEQQDDDNKKETCEKQLDEATDQLKATETAVADLEKGIEEAKELQATLVDEIATLTKELKSLDKQVEEAGIQRREEHEDYVNLMASNTAAKELIGLAKNRMLKFYNPKLAEPAAAFIQLHSQSGEAPPPPPATWDAYSKKSEESNGVIGMLDSMVNDLDKEMQEAEFEEKDAQEDYETFTKDASEKRIADSKSVADKSAAKAESEVAMDKATKDRATKMKEALATVDWIGGLHKECDWLLQNYDARKEARVGETDALKKAKAVLSGADFSFIQTRQFLQRVRA